MALNLDYRQFVSPTTDDFLRGNERYERHQRQLDVTDAHLNQIEAHARADHVLRSLRGLLEQARRANAKAQTTLKTISGTDVAQHGSTSLATIDSVLHNQATPTKAAFKRDLVLDSPAASLVMDKLRFVKQLVFVGLQVASVSGAPAPAPPSPGGAPAPAEMRAQNPQATSVPSPSPPPTVRASKRARSPSARALAARMRL